MPAETVIGVDLLGHGTAPKPHDPEAYDDLDDAGGRRPAGPTRSTRSASRSGPSPSLQLAVAQPHRFNRLVLAGIGRNAVRHRRRSAHSESSAALEGHGDPDDNLSRDVRPVRQPARATTSQR